jgi:hypothetical protein
MTINYAAPKTYGADEKLTKQSTLLVADNDIEVDNDIDDDNLSTGHDDAEIGNDVDDDNLDASTISLGWPGLRHVH